MVDAEVTAKAKSLEHFYDYTKFHIGIYITLASAYLTLIALKAKQDQGVSKLFIELNPVAAAPGVVSFMLARSAGGVIVSSITQYVGTDGAPGFLATPLGPWGLRWWDGLIWTYIEHTSFWVAWFRPWRRSSFR